MLDSKVILWCLRVKTRLQTQLATQQSSFLKHLGLVLLVLNESDWLLTGSLHCVESQTSGVRVRGQGSNQGRKLSTPCADTWVLFLQSDTASFPLTSIFSDYFNIRRIKTLFSVNQLWKLGQRGKEAIWKLLECSLFTDGLAGLREANAYVKKWQLPPPNIKGPIRIRVILQQMNT